MEYIILYLAGILISLLFISIIFYLDNRDYGSFKYFESNNIIYACSKKVKIISHSIFFLIKVASILVLSFVCYIFIKYDIINTLNRIMNLIPTIVKKIFSFLLGLCTPYLSKRVTKKLKKIRKKIRKKIKKRISKKIRKDNIIYIEEYEKKDKTK